MVAKRSISKTSVLILIGVIHTATTTTVNATTVNCTSSAYQNDRYCLKPGNGLKTWDEADEECRQQGGHLAVIRDEETQNAVANITDSMGWNRVWIGGKLEYNWRWGSKFVLWNYTNWSTNSRLTNPNILNIEALNFEGCLLVGSWYHHKYKWINRQCLGNYLKHFICEKPTGLWSCRYQYQGRCFSIHTGNTSWFNASKQCHGRRGHLAYINSQEVQTTIEQMLTIHGYNKRPNYGISFWIGGMYTADNWVWTTGQEIQSRTFFYSPIGSNKQYDLSYLCLEMWRQQQDQSDYMWDSAECGKSLNFICQFDSPKPAMSTVFTTEYTTTIIDTAEETSQISQLTPAVNTNLLACKDGIDEITFITVAIIGGMEFITILIFVTFTVCKRRKAKIKRDEVTTTLPDSQNMYSMNNDNGTYMHTYADVDVTDGDGDYMGIMMPTNESEELEQTTIHQENTGSSTGIHKPHVYANIENQ